MKKMKKVSRKMTQELFDQIKKLQALKLKIGVVKEIVGKSYFTIMYAFRAETLEDYFTMVRATVKPKHSVEEVSVKEALQEDMDGYNSWLTLLRAMEHNQQIQIELLKKIEENTVKRGIFSKSK